MKPSAAILIPKEQIASLTFPRVPVRLSATHRAQLLSKARMAMRLGNNEHGKCRILFRDNEGLKAVETTIWAADDEAIVLKFGLAIPMARIIDITVP